MGHRGVRRVVIAGLVVACAGWWSAAGARSTSPGTTCTWGGTPAAPSGRFTITPGVTNTPSTAPAAFYATGKLAGDAGCLGTLTYIGQIDAGGTCTFTTFEGAARGIPGVTRFAGVGVGPLGPARLYDRDGNVVGSENANVTTAANIPHFLDCSTPGGFTGGDFSSVIVLMGSGNG